MTKPYLERVIWLTGLSGSGKTTTAKVLNRRLTEDGLKTIWLDGDEMRRALNGFREMMEFDRASRLKNAFTYSRLCNMLSKQADVLIVSTISMFSELYGFNRQTLDDYFEVFLDIPEEVRKRRDFKEVYKPTERGGIKNTWGVDLKVDEPEGANFRYNYCRGESPEAIASKILSAMECHFQVSREDTV